MNDWRLNDHEAKRTDTRAKKRLTSEASSQVGVPVSAFAKLPSSGKGPVMTPEDLTHRVKKDCVPMIEAAIEHTMPTFHVVVEPTLNPRGIQAQAVGGREIRVAHPSCVCYSDLMLHECIHLLQQNKVACGKKKNRPTDAGKLENHATDSEHTREDQAFNDKQPKTDHGNQRTTDALMPKSAKGMTAYTSAQPLSQQEAEDEANSAVSRIMRGEAVDLHPTDIQVLNQDEGDVCKPDTDNKEKAQTLIDSDTNGSDEMLKEKALDLARNIDQQAESDISSNLSEFLLKLKTLESFLAQWKQFPDYGKDSQFKYAVTVLNRGAGSYNRLQVLEQRKHLRTIQSESSSGKNNNKKQDIDYNTLYVPGMEIEKSSFSQELMQEKNAKLMPRSPEDIVGVVIHTGGASKSSTMNSLQKRGFSTHFVIETDGKVSQALPLSMIGSHAGKANASTIGIDLTHGKGYNDKNAEYVFTRPESIKQLISLAKLIIALGESHPSIYNKNNTDWVHNAKPSDQTTDKFPGVSAHNHVPGTHTDPGEIYMQMVYLMIALTDSLQHIHGPLAPQISADLDLIVSEFNKVMENAQLPLGTYDERLKSTAGNSIETKAKLITSRNKQIIKNNECQVDSVPISCIDALKQDVDKVRKLYSTSLLPDGQ